MMWRRRDDGKTKRATRLRNLRERSWQCTNCVQSSSLWTSTSKSFNVVWFFAESYCKMRIESQLKRSRLCITCTFEFISLSCVAGRNTQSSTREHGALKEEAKKRSYRRNSASPINRHLNEPFVLLAFFFVLQLFFCFFSLSRSPRRLSTRLFEHTQQHHHAHSCQRPKQPSMLAFIRFSFFSLSPYFLFSFSCLFFFLSFLSWNS